MFRHLKSAFHLMGQGLAHQHLEEMSPTADKIVQMEQRSRNFQLSGGQSRIVLITSIDTTGPAFNFVVEMAKHTRSLIEVLYIRPADEDKSAFDRLLTQLAKLTCDFQITFLRSDLFVKISDYNSQRQDVIAVVSSNTETWAEKFRSSPQMCDPSTKIKLPNVLFVGAHIMA